mgnify:CR=1 FL=1
MGKTIRNTNDGWLKKPKSNRPQKGQVRQGFIRPEGWNDLDSTSYEEEWGEIQDENNVKDCSLKKRMSRLKRNGRKSKGNHLLGQEESPWN